MTDRTELDRLRDEQQILVEGAPEAQRLVEEVIGWPGVPTEHLGDVAELVVRQEIDRVASNEASETADMLRAAVRARSLKRAVEAVADLHDQAHGPWASDKKKLLVLKVSEFDRELGELDHRWFQVVGDPAEGESAEAGRWLVYLLALVRTLPGSSS